MKTIYTRDELIAFMKTFDESKLAINVRKLKHGNYETEIVERKPYTTFTGQTCMDEVWKTEDGRMLHVQDLEPEHARNIIRLIIRNEREYSKEMAVLAEKIRTGMAEIVDDEDGEDQEDAESESDFSARSTRVLH